MIIEFYNRPKANVMFRLNAKSFKEAMQKVEDYYAFLTGPKWLETSDRNAILDYTDPDGFVWASIMRASYKPTDIPNNLIKQYLITFKVNDTTILGDPIQITHALIAALQAEEDSSVFNANAAIIDIAQI